MALENRRVILIVEEIRGRCPVYEVGDKMAFEFPEMRLDKTEKVCLHAMPSIIHFAYALAKGVSVKETGLGKTEEKGYIQCPDPGPPYTSGGTVIFEITTEEV